MASKVTARTEMTTRAVTAITTAITNLMNDSSFEIPLLFQGWCHLPII